MSLVSESSGKPEEGSPGKGKTTTYVVRRKAKGD